MNERNLPEKKNGKVVSEVSSFVGNPSVELYTLTQEDLELKKRADGICIHILT